MEKKQENIYLDALEYGEKQLIKKKSITRQELQTYLESKGYKFTTKEERRLLSSLSREAFFINYDIDPSNRRYYLNIEGYFKLLEHRQLNDARKSSREAKRFAIIAIIISILTLIASIILSIYSIEQKMVIDDKQFRVIENIWHKLESSKCQIHNKECFLK
jgi:hypothetical protein